MARSPHSVHGIVFMTLLPLTFASDAFIPTESMPGWMTAFANANPLSHLVQALRAIRACNRKAQRSLRDSRPHTGHDA